MKFGLLLGALLFVCAPKNLQALDRFSLRKAFLGIVSELATRNHLVSLVAEDVNSDASQAAASAASVVPHIFVVWDENKSRMFELNTTAILLLDSISSVKLFSSRTFFALTFSMSQQLIFYCRNASFSDILKVPLGRFLPLIIQYEYFLIEDENTLRLLTFVWYKPQKCDIAELVEVNRFDTSTGMWRHGNIKIDKFSNFYGCQLNFLILNGAPEFNAEKIDNTTKTINQCSGYVCAIMRDLSAVLNYTYHMNDIVKKETEVSQQTLPLACDVLFPKRSGTVRRTV